MSRPIRLGFNARVFSADRVRSFTRYTSGLLQALAQMPERKEIHLFSDRRMARTHAPELGNPAFKIHRSYVKPHVAWEQLSLPMEIGLARVEVFHSTTNVGVPLFPLSNIKRVVTVHDLKPFDEVRAHLPRNLMALRDRALSEVSWQATFWADILICPNQVTAKRIETHFPELKPKLRVIPMAVDPVFQPNSAPDEAAVLKRYGLTAQQFVLYVGGYEERKNVELLIRAHRAAFRGRGDQTPTLVLVGDFADASAELLSHKSSRVRWLGYVPEPELVALYHGARCAVVPAKEGDFGLSIMEAMACGTPVIASNLESLREAAQGAAEHFAPDSQEDLKTLLQKAFSPEGGAWLADLRQKGLERSGKLNWSAVAQATFAIYRELAAATHRVTP